MKETGNSPPISVPSGSRSYALLLSQQAKCLVLEKGEWSGKERLRWAKSFGVPMAESLPPGFPANTIKVRKPWKLLGVRLIL